MSHRRKEQRGRKLRRRNIVKTEVDAEDWLLGGPHKSGNVKGRRIKKVKLFLCLTNEA
jgi:hypothetical protein